MADKRAAALLSGPKLEDEGSESNQHEGPRKTEERPKSGIYHSSPNSIIAVTIHDVDENGVKPVDLCPGHQHHSDIGDAKKLGVA